MQATGSAQGSSQFPDGICETCTAASNHFPSAFTNTKVKRAKVVVNGPSLGLTDSAVCPQTIPVLPMTRHWGLIGVNDTLSLLAKFASASCRSVALPSMGKGEKGGKATICSCQWDEYAFASRRLMAPTICSKVAFRSSMSAIESSFFIGLLHRYPVNARSSCLQSAETPSP